MTEEEFREMCRSNYAAQMAGLGYGPDGMALPKKDKSEWVSVKDRLPTYKELHDEQVLALFEDGDIASVGFDECMEPDEYFGYWHQNFDPETLGATDSEWIAIPHVTHWMKKPELPEEEA